MDRKHSICFVAGLSDGSYFTGLPSYYSTENVTDWRKLKQLVEGSDSLRIVSLSLFINGYGRFEAPKGRGSYGYFEEIERDTKGGGGIRAISLCWPESDERGDYIKVMKVKADGMLEYWRRSSWLPCMIGKPELEVSNKDTGVKV